MRVTVSAGGRFHAFHMAEQLQRLGVLNRLITSRLYYHPTRDTIDREKVVPLILPDVVGQIIKRTPGLRDAVPWGYAKDTLFDRLASRHIGPCDIFAGFASFSLHSMRVAKAVGAVTVLERGSAHIGASRALLQEEYDRWGIKTVAVHECTVQVQQQEYLETDYISVPSDFVRRSFIDQQVAAQKLIQIPYGVDLKAFSVRAKADRTFRVLFVGEVSLQKGIPYLLEAVSMLKIKDMELVLIGAITRESRAFIKKHARLLVRRGKVSHAAMPYQYSDASVFVLPSIQDGFGMVILEAMASGLPVIVSEHTAGRDVVREGIDGFVVPIRDPQAIAARLLSLYEDEPRRREMGRAARQRAEEFSWDRYGDHAVEAYQRLVRPQRAEAGSLPR